MKKIIALLLAMIMVMGLVACGNTAPTDVNADADAAADGVSATDNEAGVEDPANEETTEDSDLAYVQDKGVLVVGITDFAPMDYKDENGEWIGFDADMARAFAETLGVEVEFVEINWDMKAQDLEVKNIDCVWNGMTLTNEVMSAMATTKPYSKNAQVVVVPAAVADQYATAEACMDLTFAVEAGSAGEAAATDNGFEFTPLETQAAALMEVAAGNSDACIIDLLMAMAMTGEGTDYADLTYTLELNEENYGVGFRVGSDLAAELDAFFDAAYADGTMMACAEQYGIAASVELAMAD